MAEDTEEDTGPTKRIRLNRGLVNEVKEYLKTHREYKNPADFFNEAGREHLAKKRRENHYLKSESRNTL